MYKSVVLEKINKSVLEDLKNANLTAVSIQFEDADKDAISLIKEILGEGIEINIIFKCFEGKELQEKFPQTKPVEVEGKQVSTVNYHPVSPIYKEVSEYLLEKLNKVLDLDVNLVILDHLHFPTKWWVEDPEILDTDYSDFALSKFEEYIGEEIEGSNLEEKYLHIDGSYYHEWLLFKSGFINDFVTEVKKKLKEKNIKTGVFIVPWEEKEYRAGITRILGQDHSVLVDLADEMVVKMPYVSMNKDTSWVKSRLEYFWHLGKMFISYIDVEKTEDMDALRSVLNETPSKGLMISSDYSKLGL